MNTDYNESLQVELGKKNKQLLLIMRPLNFALSQFTKEDNHFMEENNEFTPEQIKEGAKKEHAELENLLLENKIAYKIFEQTNPEAHDSCFVSDSLICIKNQDFPTGLVVICPMYWPNRQLEKYPHIYEWLKNTLGYEHLVDLSYFEKEKKALEGKGVTLFDWTARTLYIGESNRAHPEVMQKLVDVMSEISGQKYELFIVKSFDKKVNQAHFHTSSYMMIFNKCAVICSEVLSDMDHFNDMKKKLESSGKVVVECTYEDMQNGATLGVEYFNADGTNGLILSDFCEDVSEEIQYFFDDHFNNLIYLTAPILVDVGGSSVECLIQTVPL